MAYNALWGVSAALGGAGALTLLGPARSQVGRLTRGFAALLTITAALDLALGDIVALPLPLSAWTSALLVLAIAVEHTRAAQASKGAQLNSTQILSQQTDSEQTRSGTGNDQQKWMVTFDAANDAIAILDSELRPRTTNLAWTHLFANADDSADGHTNNITERARQALRTLIEQAPELDHHQGFIALLPPDDHAPAQEKAALSAVSMIRLPESFSPATEARLVVIPSTQAQDLAQLTRRLSHNFNNLLSAIVGAAGMAMDSVPEDSQLYRELVDIEDVAMRAAEITSELQQAARDVAPPSAQAPVGLAHPDSSS